MFEFSSNPTIEKLRSDHEAFNHQLMKWGPWQTPRNLLLALIGELGELSTDVVRFKRYKVADHDEESKDEDAEESKDEGVEESKDEGVDAESNDEGLKVEEVLNEVTDVLSYLICLANECNVDLACPDTRRSDQSGSKFSSVSWNEIEVTAFYRVVEMNKKSSLIDDFLSVCLCGSNLKDQFQWTDVEKNLTNLSDEQKDTVDEIIKQLFCHVVVLASKYEFDLPKLLQEKNVKTAKKYIKSIGILTKEDVIKTRYKDLPSFSLDKKCIIVYPLDKIIDEEIVPVKELLCKLVQSIGFISEAFQWDTDGTNMVYSTAKLAHVAKQIATIIHTVQTIAQVYKISLANAFNNKMRKNRRKYPISLSRGTFVKSSTKSNTTSDDLDDETYSAALTIGDASSAMALFVEERDWQKYHKNPRNLTLALFGEIGEVIELFIYKESSTFQNCLMDELADCLAYSVRLASSCNIDLSAALANYYP